MEILYSYDKIDSILVHNMRNYSYYVKHGLNYNAIEKSLARFYDCPKIPCSYEHDKLEILNITCNQCKNTNSLIINEKSISENESIITSVLGANTSYFIELEELSHVIVKELSLNDSSIKLCYFTCSHCNAQHLLIYKTESKEVSSNNYINIREILGLIQLHSLMEHERHHKFCNNDKTINQSCNKGGNYVIGRIYPNSEINSSLTDEKSIMFYSDSAKNNFHIWEFVNNAVVIGIKHNEIYYRIGNKLYCLLMVDNKAKRCSNTPNNNFIELYKDLYFADMQKQSYCIENSTNVLHINNIEDYFNSIRFIKRLKFKFAKLYLRIKYSFIASCRNIKYEIMVYQKYGINPRKIYSSSSK